MSLKAGRVESVSGFSPPQAQAEPGPPRGEMGGAASVRAMWMASKASTVSVDQSPPETVAE